MPLVDADLYLASDGKPETFLFVTWNPLDGLMLHRTRLPVCTSFTVSVRIIAELPYEELWSKYLPCGKKHRSGTYLSMLQ